MLCCLLQLLQLVLDSSYLPISLAAGSRVYKWVVCLSTIVALLLTILLILQKWPAMAACGEAILCSRQHLRSELEAIVPHEPEWHHAKQPAAVSYAIVHE
jgi:hypothetical protein